MRITAVCWFSSLLLLFTTTTTTMANNNNNINDNEDTEWGRAIEKQTAASCPTTTTTTVDDEVDIAIVGGGLVGLAVAIGLQSSSNSNNNNVKIYERSQQLRSNSQGILAMQPNGMQALDSIQPEIMHKVVQQGCERHYFRKTSIDADGITTDKTINSGDDFLTKYGRRKVGISWHNMQRILASQLDEDVVKTGHSLQSFREEKDSVVLYFENGSVVRAKVVLACDGVFSAARRQLKDDDSPIFFGQLNWGTIIQTAKLPPNMHDNNTVRYITHDGEPRWMSMINDGGSGYTFWQLRLADPVKGMALSGNKGRGGLGLPGAKERLLPLVNEICDDVANTIRAIPEEQIFERSIVGRYPLDSWLSEGGRLVLVGDSAHGMHPNIGQGANQGFISAALIVKMLRTNPGDHKKALGEFERMRKPRAEIVQQFANAMGVLQATGQQVFSQQEMQDMMGWIIRNDDAESAPVSIVEFLKDYDPCNQPGVSKLW